MKAAVDMMMTTMMIAGRHPMGTAIADNHNLLVVYKPNLMASPRKGGNHQARG